YSPTTMELTAGAVWFSPIAFQHRVQVNRITLYVTDGDTGSFHAALYPANPPGSEWPNQAGAPAIDELILQTETTSPTLGDKFLMFDNVELDPGLYYVAVQADVAISVQAAEPIDASFGQYLAMTPTFLAGYQKMV